MTELKVAQDREDFQQRWYTQIRPTGDLSVGLPRIPLLEAVLQLRRDLGGGAYLGESEALGWEARMREVHIGVAWRALVVVDMG
jgi:hypothetical protein